MIDNLENGWVGTEDRESYSETKYTCEWCGENICDGDEYYDLEGVKVCADCIRNKRRMA